MSLLYRGHVFFFFAPALALSVVFVLINRFVSSCVATRDMVKDGKCALSAIAAVSRQLVSLDFKYAGAHANVYKLRSVLAGA